MAIHTSDVPTKILYVSSGCRLALGFTPEFIIEQGGTHYIADSFSDTDYSMVFAERELDDDEDDVQDEPNVFMMWLYIHNSDQKPILHRILAFKCGGCVVCVNTAFLDAPFNDHRELEVQALDGAMRKINISQQVRERQALGSSSARPKRYAQSRFAKAAFVLENPFSIIIETSETKSRPAGPLIAFVSGSVSNLIDADTADLQSFPFLKLVAPEDVLRVSKYLEVLAGSRDVQFERFSLLQQPQVYSGDVLAGESENRRIVVESLGAAAHDGIMLLLRKVGVKQSKDVGKANAFLESDDDQAQVSLADLMSSDCETSEAPEWWSTLN
ncbi:hypothetical protein EV183_005584 [Coemansia sp. RSA 2336]|nr:hypothetical protein EV183_005584 [Coemansia sp. RSA 2336]